MSTVSMLQARTRRAYTNVAACRADLAPFKGAALRDAVAQRLVIARAPGRLGMGLSMSDCAVVANHLAILLECIDGDLAG